MQIVKLEEISEQAVVEAAVAVLRHGGIVIYPTETVYGVGVDATNQEAVDKLLRYKARREGKPLSVAVTDVQMAENFVELNDQARTLYQQFMPGPITIISADKGKLARGVASEFATLGIRIPDYPLIRQLVTTLGSPITATSANTSGKRRPYTIEHVFQHLSNKQMDLLDFVIDAGELPKRPPSTVIDTTLSTPVVMRAGKLTSQGKIAQEIKARFVSKGPAETQAIAGKLLLKHWGELKQKPLVIGLDGPLGAGKTVFAQGVGQFLHIPAPLVSPTYSYIEEYAFNRLGRSGRLIHADVWKIDSADMLSRIGLVEWLKPSTVVIIEWLSQVKDWLQADLHTSKAVVLEVAIAEGASDSERLLAVSW